MKNQYFGDKRDFIKYSLISDILDHHPELSTFVFIPMLTRSDSTKEGNVREYHCEARNEGIYQFLAKNHNNRSIKNWRNFFRDRYSGRRYIVGDLDETPEQNSKAKYFEHHIRQEYFAVVSKWDINNALVFIDPDIGIQPKNKRYWNKIANKPESAEKYLLNSDIELLVKHIPNSVLMIYQHLQNNKNKHEAQAGEKLQALSGFFDGNVTSVRCTEVQYLFASKSTSLQKAINTTLRKHASRNGMKFEWAQNSQQANPKAK